MTVYAQGKVIQGEKEIFSIHGPVNDNTPINHFGALAVAGTMQRVYNQSLNKDVIEQVQATIDAYDPELGEVSEHIAEGDSLKNLVTTLYFGPSTKTVTFDGPDDQVFTLQINTFDVTAMEDELNLQDHKSLVDAIISQHIQDGLVSPDA